MEVLMENFHCAIGLRIIGKKGGRGKESRPFLQKIEVLLESCSCAIVLGVKGK
jgi:hypothetical protein